MATASDWQSTSPFSGTVSTDLSELSRTAKVLIVDDCPIVVKTVQKHLRSAGFENLICTTESCEAVDMVIPPRKPPALPGDWQNLIVP